MGGKTVVLPGLRGVNAGMRPAEGWRSAMQLAIDHTSAPDITIPAAPATIVPVDSQHGS
jgi:hypothetical protein